MSLKILYLTPHIPYPPDAGPKITALNTIRGLQKKGAVIDILSMGENCEHINEAGLKQHVRNLFFVKSPSRLPGLLSASFKNKSAVFGRFFSKKYLLVLLQVYRSYDIIIANHPYMAQYFDFLDDYRGTMVTNVEVIEHRVYADNAKYEKNIFRKAFFRFEAGKLRKAELDVIGKVPFNFSYSEFETQYLKELGMDNIYYRPLGMDMANYRYSEYDGEEKGLLIFFGDYKWQPNRDGALYILREVFPSLKKRLKDLKLEIIGRNASREIMELCGQEGVSYVGEVEKIEDYIDRAAFVLCTIRIGGGVRLKVLESLAKGKITIVNRISSEGILNKDVMLFGDDIAELTDKLRYYMENRGEAMRLKRAARQYVETYHSVEHATDYLLKTIGMNQ